MTSIELETSKRSWRIIYFSTEKYIKGACFREINGISGLKPKIILSLTQTFSLYRDESFLFF